MAELKGDWTKTERKIIWADYVENKMWRIFKNLNELEWNWEEQAPCPKCGKRMKRAQYQRFQPNKKFSWDIDYKNGNPKDNYIDNLQPMHPYCNRSKN